MAHGRSIISLLCAFAALFVVPAAASAQAPPTNDTPATPGGWMTAPYAVNLAGTDPEGTAVTMNWRLDGGVIDTVTNGGQIIVSDSGDWDFETQAVDGDGMDSGWRLESLRIDTILPTDGTDVGGPGWRNATANISVFAADVTSGVDHVEWELDGGLTQSGPNSSTVPISGDGVHALRTRAVDVAGNVSVWRDHTVRIDTVTPTDTTSPPGGWQTTPLLVNITGNDALSGVDRVQYRLNGGSTVETATPAGLTVSTEGVNDLQTRVRDAAGNWTGWKASTVRVDTTAPTNQTDVSDGVWTTANYAVDVKAADGLSGLAEVEYRIDGGPWVQGPSGITASITGTGDHTLETRGRDVAGNTSIARLDHVRIDKVAPVNTTAPAPGGQVANPYTVPVTGTDAHSGVARVEWRVDGGAVHTGASGTVATVTGHGSHTLETRVVDNVGYDTGWRSETVDVDAISGDTTDPVDTTTTAPAGWRPGTINVTVGATDAGSGVKEIQWRVDGLPKQVDAGPTKLIQITGEGVHHLETMAIDVAGNETAWRSQYFRIDQTVPTDTTDVPADWQHTTTFTLSATDAHSGVAEIEYTVDGGPLLHGTNGQVVDVGGDGTFTITTRAIDNAGHAAPPRTHTLKVDTVLPANTSAIPAGGWLTEALELALSGTDAGSGFKHVQWRVDGGMIHDGGPAVVDTDGAHTLETRAVDNAGNHTAWRSDAVSIDATAPENTTPAAPTGWRSTPYAVELTGDDGDGSGIDVYEHTIDGGAVSNDTDVEITGDGEHVLRTRIVDTVGHASAWREETIKIDSVAPVAALACSGGVGVWSPVPVACTATAAGGPSGLGALTVNGAAVASGAAVPVTADGTSVLSFHAADGAGNTASAQATVNVDATAPTAGLTCTAAGGKYTCTVDGADATSGLAALGYSVDGGAWTDIAPGATFTVAKGKVRARAVDVAGHETISAEATLAAVKTPGTIKVSSVPVYLAGKKNPDSLVGALHAVRSASGTVSLDLRPLAVGRGRYKVEISLKSGKHSRKVRKTYKVGGTGALPRVSASLAKATERTTVSLTVRKRVGGKWKKYAATRMVLAK